MAAIQVPMLLPTELEDGWGDEEGGGWLLSYIDILSIFLALLVILIGHQAAATRTTEDAVPAGTEDALVRPLEPVPEAASPTISTPAPRAAEELPAQWQAPLPAPAGLEYTLGESGNPSLAGQPLPASAADLAPAEAVKTSHATPPATTGPVDRSARLAAAVGARFPGLIKAAYDERGVSLEIADAVLFESGRAELADAAKPVLTRLLQTLDESGEAQLVVQGHTDDRPLHGGRFPSNWELSAARATAVTRFLIGQGLAPSRVRATGFADTRPLADNDTAEGRARNRRVNLVVEFTGEEAAGGTRPER